MDYSAIHHDDPDHAANGSPWATSPRPSKAAFSPRTSTEEPPPQFPNTAMSSRQSSAPDRPSLETSQDTLDQQDDLSKGPTAVEHGVQDPFQSSTHPQRNDQAPPPPAPPQQEQPPMSQQQPQSRPRQAQRYHGNRAKSRQEQTVHRLQPKVTGIERPSRKELIVRFDIHTNLPGFRTTQFRDVRRTHAEFERLTEHLISANSEALVPALPPSSTPAGIGTDEDEFRVRTNMQKWMNVVFGNEVLMRDDETMRFIESDPGYSPVIKQSQPATGVRRKYLKQFAPPPDDTPELFDARPVVKHFYLGTMDAGQKMDKAVRARRSLGNAESDLSVKLHALNETELHPGLKAGYRKLSRTIQTVGDLHSVQGTTEATVLGEPLHYHSADSYIVKETLTNRHLLLRDLAQAQHTTSSKLNAADRLKSSTSVRRDKVDEALAALDDARHHEAYLHTKTTRVTSNLLHESRAWTERTASELRSAVRELAAREIESERRTLAVLEAARPEVRAIDAGGGLSRLGRESTPAAARKTSSLVSSQGPRGDAWSGVQRRKGEGVDRSISGSYEGGAFAGEDGGEGGDAGGAGRARAGAEEGRPGSGGTGGAQGKKSGKSQDDDEDRVDARNAANRLAASTF